MACQIWGYSLEPRSGLQTASWQFILHWNQQGSVSAISDLIHSHDDLATQFSEPSPPTRRDALQQQSSYRSFSVNTYMHSGRLALLFDLFLQHWFLRIPGSSPMSGERQSLSLGYLSQGWLICCARLRSKQQPVYCTVTRRRRVQYSQASVPHRHHIIVPSVKVWSTGALVVAASPLRSTSLFPTRTPSSEFSPLTV